MCLVAIALNAHPTQRFVLLGNRDEAHTRATQPLAWYHVAGHEMLAGRDLVAGGTWLAIDRRGRFGVITNYRDPAAKPPGGPSRGELIPNFLASGLAAADFLADLHTKSDQYAPFNLIVGDVITGEARFSSNRRIGANASATPLTRGVHGLSNGSLNSPWPKTVHVRERLAAVLAANSPQDRDTTNNERLFEILADRTGAADERLPDTGVGLAAERVLAPAFIVSEQYGTRCSSVLTVSDGGLCRFVERSFNPQGIAVGEVSMAFQVEAAVTGLPLV